MKSRYKLNKIAMKVEDNQTQKLNIKHAGITKEKKWKLMTDNTI